MSTSKPPCVFDFNEEQIQALFGYEAAEDEDVNRLRKYFFKNETYEKIDNDLPLRILVGHKGIGKSAIFKMAYLNNVEKKKLALWIRPDDIAELCVEDSEDTDFLLMIRSWKKGLEELIYTLIFQNIGSSIDNEKIRSMVGKGIKILESVSKIFASEDFHVEEAKKAIVKNFLSEQNLYIFIDDLDRGWTGSKGGIRRISSLLSAVRDLSNDNRGLCFRISLRSDVYFLVRTSDESTDKIDGSVIWLSWTSHQILVLLAKRIQSYLGIPFSEKEMMKTLQFVVARKLDPIFCDRFEGEGKWKDAPIYKILVSMIRRRPRDLVKLCTLAAREANTSHHSRIMTEDFQMIFDRYSQDRIQDAINEHRYELPDIERLLLGMKPSKQEKKASLAFVYSEEQILRKIDGIMQTKKFRFSNGNIATSRELLIFMYKINFIVARKQTLDGYIDRRYFEDNKYLATDYAVFGYEWEIHPAYRWALYPESRDTFKAIDLENEIII